MRQIRSPLDGFRSPFGRTQGGGAPFAVSFTGLSTDSLGSYGQIGNHAAISYTINPDLGTETVKWSNSSNPADAATFGTGASPTTFASVDGFSVFLHVTDDPGDGAVTRSFSFPARKAPATGGTDLDLAFPEDSAISSTNLIANWTDNGNTLTFVSVSPALPTGLSISSAGAMTGTPTTVTADAAYTLTMEDEYGRETSDTFTLEITDDPVLTLISDDLDQDPPEYSLDSDTAGTLRWDFHTSATPPAAGAGDIATGTESIVIGSNTITLDLSAYGGETGYLHFRLGSSNILTSMQITVPGGYGDYTVISTANTFISGATRTATGLSPLEFGLFGGVTVASAGGTWNIIGNPASGLPTATSGVPIVISALVKAGTSGRARVEFALNTVGTSRVLGALGSIAINSNAGGTISGLSQTNLGSDNWLIEFTVTPSGTNTYTINVGPDSATSGQNIIWLGVRSV